jgi:hypothetical protein
MSTVCCQPCFVKVASDTSKATPFTLQSCDCPIDEYDTMCSEERGECYVCDVLELPDCHMCDMRYSRMRDYEKTKMMKCDLCDTASCCGVDFVSISSDSLKR